MEEGRWKREREERKAVRYKVYSQRSSFGLGERRREGHLEKSEEKYWSFYVSIYLYIIYIYII